MATESELNTADAVQNCLVDSVKSTFCAWLSDGNAKQTDHGSIIASLDNASEQLLRRKITYTPLWEITKYAIFADVYKKAMNNKFFRIMDRKTYSAFVRDGQLFLKFLKSKPVFQQQTEEVIIESSDHPTSQMTIKNAVIKVLKAEERAMTAEEIYGRIIEQHLYMFGAQNPVNVVRTTIEYACENSGYSNKDAIPCFRFERNSDGKRIYSLLEIATQQVNPAKGVATTDTFSEKGCDVIIWGDKVEHEFQKWLVRDNYSQKTADNYRRAAAEIFRKYSALARKAANDSSSELEAIRKYIASLNKDNGFLDAISSRHNQFTAALAALEHFYSSVYTNVENEGGDFISEQSDVRSISDSPLDDIVDLDEGKVGIRHILEAHFQTLYGYSNIGILWNAVQDTLSMFLNDNAINNADDLRMFMQRAFSGEYVLSNPHIWKTAPNYPQSFVGVTINLARQLGGTVTRDQIDDYFARIKQSSPINATIIRQGLLMFYANKHFILTEAVSLTSERCATITKLLNRLFDNERVPYIVLRDITDEWFSTLPTIQGGASWTALLLQEVLRLRPGIGYRVIFSGLDRQALDTLGAAIVPSKSGINTFADVAHRYCYEKDLLSKRMVTEDLRIILRDAGMLDGNELIYNLHKALRDYRFAFTDENRMVKILER